MVISYTSADDSLDDDAGSVDLASKLSYRFAWIFIDVRIDVRTHAAAIRWQVRHRYTVHNRQRSIHRQL